MDVSLKKCCVDRLSSLPDELICQILSSFPTKDAAIVSLTSKKMRSVFMYLTTLNFDDPPIIFCGRENPQLIQRFQKFKTFVDNVLQKSQATHLSKFRLGFGGDVTVMALHYHGWSEECGKHCFLDLEATKLDSWIRFPLNRCGIREIDLRIHVREPGKLPSAFFTCETLEVLKLDTNLDFELVFSLPSFRLPNLKVLQLHSIIIPEDDFVGRLVSNCPLLQELCIDCWWKYGKSVIISSPSLQKLVLKRDYHSGDPGDLVNIGTPNLQYFKYEDTLALHYSVTSMKAPVQASINVYCNPVTAEWCFQSMLNLLRAVCNVQRLSFLFSCFEELDSEDFKNQLPIFHNLTHLELGNNSSCKWITLVFEFLMCSPVLEVLEFPEGINTWYVVELAHESHRMIAESERWFFRKNHVRSYCCKPHLKRIIIKKYRGTMREVEFVRFLLEFAPALQELLIICESKDDLMLTRHYVDPASAESTLKKLPMASSTCLITVK